jgi:hypothetical protein
MDDGRIAPRRRVFKDGVIQANGIGTACSVRNISASGALLVVNIEEAIEQLTLVVVSENLIKKCSVVWRDGDRMGVTFV